ncbi:conserved hypothetical protein [uncultured Paludibacter sp.]|uniref:Tagaturonate/fructuronate epimerase n=1 Tax=uncultured Paludibacter sp. TaxID=497635 RepID=A0A653ALB2_9BACT|nr:conserved hypothetical protein [uncultured Paludibacter sp.]
MKLDKYSIGIGDRFSHQGEAQLRAIMGANNEGIKVSPVWNKSNREHTYVHSKPDDTRNEADSAVKKLNFKGNYFVDADHINLNTVAPFIKVSNFFTLDIAALIGKKSEQKDIDTFIASCEKYIGKLSVPEISEPLNVTKELVENVTYKFLAATKHASEIYQFLKKEKGKEKFITEISMDEVEVPQTPIEMLFILKMLANMEVPVQTIAPKFTGRFNKGVDYIGDLENFEKEFEEHILVIDFAIKEFGLPKELKISIHSGSDKFSIYPIINKIIKKHDKGLHLKTAGTTWLEEVIGLAKAEGDGLKLAKKIYATSFNRSAELCAPYADVINIDNSKLPSIEEVNIWTSKKFVDALQHEQDCPDYNPDFRQLIHVAYKVAAELGTEFTNMLKKNSNVIGKCVEDNIYRRHIKKIFVQDIN